MHAAGGRGNAHSAHKRKGPEGSGVWDIMEEFGEKVVAGARRLSHDFSKDKKKQTSQGRAAVKEALNAIKRTSSNFFAQATGGLPELSEQTHSAIVLKLCDEQQWEERRIILTKEAMYLASAEDDSMKDIVPLFQVEEVYQSSSRR